MYVRADYRFDILAMPADDPAEIRQHAAPDPGTQRREGYETCQMHPGDASRDRDHVSDHREEASDQGADFTVAPEEISVRSSELSETSTYFLLAQERLPHVESQRVVD